MKKGIFDAVALLSSIVVKKAESIFAESNDCDEVASGEKCHTKIADIPHDIEANKSTKHHHHTAGHHAIEDEDDG